MQMQKTESDGSDDEDERDNDVIAKETFRVRRVVSD